MKKSKIVLMLSLVLLIVLVVAYIFTKPEPDEPVSPREQYQQEYNQTDAHNTAREWRIV